MKRLKDYLKKKERELLIIHYTRKKKYINYYWKFLKLFYYEDYIKFKRD